MIKTFQYMLKQIKPILIEIVKDKDLGNFKFNRSYITQIVEKYHDKESTIKGTRRQILDSYFIKIDNNYFIHPMLEQFLGSKKNQNEILHYGLNRYVEPYFRVIQTLYDEFNRAGGFYNKRKEVINLKLMNIFDESISQKSILNNINRALVSLKECGLIEEIKDARGMVNLCIKNYEPNPIIFYYSFLDELKSLDYPGCNEGYILNNLKITKIWFLRKKSLSKVLNSLLKLKYITFGQLTGGTINFNKEKISKWRFLYDF